LLNLVGAVISYARWDGADPAVLEDLGVLESVTRTNVDIVSAATAKGVTYLPAENAIADDVCVRAEPLRLREILMQLLLNAVKFSRARDTISVSARKVGARVSIRISDTGIGIDESEQDAIFQPFVRARDAYVWGQPGVGLGLAITQKLARAMDGEVSVVSAPGGGSTFTLMLPCGRHHTEEPLSATP
jgi:signal transduction histidine kinase